MQKREYYFRHFRRGIRLIFLNLGLIQMTATFQIQWMRLGAFLWMEELSSLLKAALNCAYAQTCFLQGRGYFVLESISNLLEVYSFAQCSGKGALHTSLQTQTVPISASGPQDVYSLDSRSMQVREVGKVDLQLREMDWL